MSVYSALSPVSGAVYAALNVAALTSLLVSSSTGAQGSVVDSVPIGNVRPFLFFEVSNAKQLGGFGTWPGHKDLPECELRLHVIDDQPNVSECQTILAMAVQLIYQPGALSVAGYTVCAGQPMTDIQLLNLGDQIIAGVVVHEEVAIVRLLVENNT